MREIKFRAWSKKENKYYHEVGFHRSIIMWNDGYKKTALGALTVSPMFENYIIEQYTGLKDKNGVEIYDGDFLHIDNSRICARDVKGKVVFEYGCFNVVDDKNIYYTFCEMGESIISIIGNIHENPELIEEDRDE